MHMKEAEIRLELRRHGGHKAKVNDTVLLWLEEFDRIHVLVTDLIISHEDNRHRAEEGVHRLSLEVLLLQQSPSSITVLNSKNDADGVATVPGSAR